MSNGLPGLPPIGGTPWDTTALGPATSILGTVAGGANPATLPLTLLLALLPALFGQNRGQRDMRDLIKYLKPTEPMYMSPNLPQVDEATLRAILNQSQRTQNWGWPSGT